MSGAYKTPIVLLAALALLLPACLAWQLDVVLYEDINYGGRAVDFQVHDSLKCYNIHECFNDQMSSFKITASCDIPTGMYLVLAADIQCPWNDWSDFCTADNSQDLTAYVNLVACQTVSVPWVGSCLNDQVSAFIILEDWQSNLWWNSGQYTFGC